MTEDERNSEVLALQIGRPLRAASKVLRRCNLDLPIVIDVPPILDTGEPFPTRYWLTCPLAHRRIARIEAEGGVRAAQAKIAADQGAREALEAAHARYARDRDALLPAGTALSGERTAGTALSGERTAGPRHRPSGGVGGSAGGVKCLHAHYADFAAGNDNAIGRDLHGVIGEPRCNAPCVAVIDGTLQRNPDWREPSHDDDSR
ncbi:MAG: DUF501 domain-containing protein [Deltaproteobacteria bacterium]|nr:DUF501 domain-containing protein [Deltaproteobacteria bacterium]MBW2213044.1 DUF501 domain-containing protein [Deltaproteobacteria bacterium]MBW2550060.1 DUF501 domain-containing protein [Deltaproteobacteria bacterium]MBW2684728.1 DUF501 domain-containing protein [Deltaproteobacteria bacterium]